MRYVALLRGINVGGNNKIKMADLKTCLEKRGLTEVITYIQSGNIIFSSEEKDKEVLAKKVEEAIKEEFTLEVPTVVFSQNDMKNVLDEVPSDWLKKEGWRCYYFFLITPYKIEEVMASIGELKPDIESLAPGKGVLYQSVDMSKYGRATTSKIIGKPVYKIITMRNHNTVQKLYELMSTAV